MLIGQARDLPPTFYSLRIDRHRNSIRCLPVIFVLFLQTNPDIELFGLSRRGRRDRHVRRFSCKGFCGRPCFRTGAANLRFRHIRFAAICDDHRKHIAVLRRKRFERRFHAAGRDRWRVAVDAERDADLFRITVRRLKTLVALLRKSLQPATKGFGGAAAGNAGKAETGSSVSPLKTSCFILLTVRLFTSIKAG